MDESKSIEELENDYWSTTEFPTPLVEKCYTCRTIPINELSVEQIRLLLGQKIGIKFLLHKAIQFLQEDILSEGDFYPGDLLVCVLCLDLNDWKDNAKLRTQFERLLSEKESEIIASDDTEIQKKVADYKKNRPRKA
jgi:hypothetical protein